MVGLNQDGVVLDTARMFIDPSVEYWRGQQRTFQKGNRVVKRATQILREMTKKVSGDGYEVLKQINYLLKDGFGVKRSVTQVEIHQTFIESCLPKIFQSTWQQDRVRILKDFNVKQLIQEVLVVMPRRRGKTYSTAMFAAACLLCIPECSCIIFSVGERIAKLLMDVIRQMMENAFRSGALKREDYVIDTDNKESLVFYGPDGTKRSLMCLPSSVRVFFNMNGPFGSVPFFFFSFFFLFFFFFIYFILSFIISLIKHTKHIYEGKFYKLGVVFKEMGNVNGNLVFFIFLQLCILGVGRFGRSRGIWRWF